MISSTFNLVAVTALATIAFAPSVTFAKPSRVRRIVNGDDADIGEYPWFVSMRMKRSGQHFCGATLINPDTIVTAAHCVYYEGKVDKPHTIVVNVGSHTLDDKNSGILVGVTKIFPHRRYNERNSNNDIAVLKLAECVDVEGIKADTRTERALFAEGGDWNVGLASMVGHGVAEYGSQEIENVLKESQQTLLTHAQCSKIFQDESGDGNVVNANSMICGSTENPNGGERTDTCQGDSGGPFVTKVGGKWVLTGVTSWGYSCASKTPGVYARVAAYTEWLKVNGATTCKPASPTQAPAPTKSLSPTSAPSPAPPTPSTISPTASPSQVDNSCHIVSCGQNGRCKEESSCAAHDEIHEVRCCSDTILKSWKRRTWDCPWTASKKFNSENMDCQHGLNFDQAKDFCKAVGGRLCTEQEAKDDCLKSTGCGHDADLVWTSTSNIDESSSTVTTTSSTTMTTSTDYDNAVRSEKSCKELKWRKPHFLERICGASKSKRGNDWECTKHATYQQAVDTCTAQGARVCAEWELYFGAAGTTGCGFDSKYVWSTDECKTNKNAVGRLAVRRWHNDFVGSSTICKPVATSQKMMVRCCADMFGTDDPYG